MSIPDRLKNNLALKLLSIAIALLIWGLVHNQADPLEVRYRTVPVEAGEVPEKLAAAAIDPKEITVALFGRASAFAQLEYSNFRLVANVPNTEAGVQTVPVTALGLPKGLEIRQLSRTMVRVELDSIISATRPVFAQMRGEPAPGFAVSGSSASPASVTVSGPSSKLQQVARVVAEVDVTGRSGTGPVSVSLTARDAGNVVVSGLRMTPAEAAVTVQIRQVNSKTVPVVPIISNVPAGYEVSNISVTPVTVTLTGPSARLTPVNSVQTAPINLSGRQRDRRSFSVSLHLPAGTTAIGGASASVTVDLRPSATVAGPQPEETGGATATPSPASAPAPTILPEPATTPSGGEEAAPSPANKPVPSAPDGHSALPQRNRAPQPEPFRPSHPAPVQPQ